MINRYVLFLFLGLLATLLTGSCTQERQPCLVPKTASLNIECVHFATDSATTPVDTLLPMAIFGAATNSGFHGFIYTPNSSFILSLAPDSGVCQWLMTTDSFYVVPDTLTFFYQKQLKFISNACGYTDFFSLDSVHSTHNSIDSIIILNRSVTNDPKVKQLNIYIHPDY
jgi:hypothetical protein